MQEHRKQEYKMIGLNIAYYRKMKGLTQLQLAEAVNISRTHISNIEAPNVPTSISLETFLSGCKHFYRFEECLDGFKSFYEQFLSVQRNGASTGSHFILFDEWASYLNILDKKECEEAKKNLSSLLMLGRSFDFHVILSQQRLDAESFGKSRDNVNLVIILGNPSKEVQSMLLNDYKDQIQPDRKRGTGFLLENNCNFQKIVTPSITNMPLVEKYIREAVER